MATEVEKYLWFRGKSQREIAHKLGISGSYASEICSGKSQLPFRLVKPLADLTGATIEVVVEAFTKVHNEHIEQGKKNYE